MTSGEQGRDRDGKDDDDGVWTTNAAIVYDALDLFDYGDAPPLSPSPTSPRQASAPLQCNVEDDDSDGGNVAVGPMYRG